MYILFNFYKAIYYSSSILSFMD